MDSEAILARVSEAKVQRDLPELIHALKSVDPKLVFDTLFPISIRPQGGPNGPVAFSAHALHALNPPCLIELSTAIAMLAENWDVSIEQVPWYLANQFGAEELYRCIDNALETETDEIAHKRLEIARYWVPLNPAMT